MVLEYVSWCMMCATVEKKAGSKQLRLIESAPGLFVCTGGERKAACESRLKTYAAAFLIIIIIVLPSSPSSPCEEKSGVR
jgi:hypothetical protein